MKHLDKVKHLGLFLLGFLVSMFICTMGIGMADYYAAATSSLLVAVVAFLTEDRQRKQPGRVKDGWDAYADMLSIPIGMLLFPYLFKVIAPLLFVAGIH